jgi:HAE1 family hydrophobic/amphiphilic exporter-1
MYIRLSSVFFQWMGLALEEVEAGGKTILIFGPGILVVYLTLSPQYEGFALPLIILLAVPTAVLGVLLFISAWPGG